MAEDPVEHFASLVAQAAAAYIDDLFMNGSDDGTSRDDVYARFKRMIEAGEVTLGVDLAEEGTEFNGPLVPSPNVDAMVDEINRLQELRRGSGPPPGSTLIMHPDTWRLLSEDLGTPEIARSLSVANLSYPVILADYMLRDEVFAVRPGWTPDPNLAMGLRGITWGTEEAKEAVEEVAGEFDRAPKVVQALIAALKRAGPFRGEEYFDRVKTGSIRRQDAEINAVYGSLLWTQAYEALVIQGHSFVAIYLEFEQPSPHEDGTYIVTKGAVNRIWSWTGFMFSRVWWEGPDFTEVAGEFLGHMCDPAPCVHSVGDEVEYAGMVLKLAKRDYGSDIFLFKRMRSRWSRPLFWLQVAWNGIEKRWIRVRYRAERSEPE